MQGDLLKVRLVDFIIHMNHELAPLANKIDWRHFERIFEKFYSSHGRAVILLIFMVSCLLLIKQMSNLGNKTLPQMWIQNP
jgi:flagellar biosynthesis/type III secretory pathway M-ring protein FliF/YscJ